MARASWGNVGVDYSSFFADLARGADNKKKSEQRANDNLAASKWAAGEMPGDEWLAYISQRLAETKDDPEENAYWQERQIEDTRYVNDAKAEEAYLAAGSLGLVAYLEYHKGVLAQMQPGTKGYTDREQLVYRLQDEIDQNDWSKLAADAITRINNGDPNAYQDLIKVWTDAKAKVRPGSSFQETIDSKLAEAKNAYRTFKAQTAEGQADVAWGEGKLTGKQYAAKLRAIANTYYKADPNKYYALLNDANKFSKLGNGKAGGSGGGGGKGGGGGGTSVTRIVDTLKANIAQALSIQDQISAAAGRIDAKVQINGREYSIYKADGTFQTWVDEFHAQTVLTYDALIDAQSKSTRKSDKTGINTTRNKKSDFIIKNVQPNNSLIGDQMLGRLTDTFNQRWTAALDDSLDPNAALNVVRDYVNDLRGLRAKYSTATTAPDNPNDFSNRGVSSTVNLDPANSATGAWIADLDRIIGNYTAALNGQAPTNLNGVTTSLLSGGSGWAPTSGDRDILGAIAGTAQSAACLSDGTCSLVQYPPTDGQKGGVTVVPIVPTIAGPAEDPNKMSEILGNAGGTGWRVVNVKVHGKMIPLKTVAVPLSIGNGWQAQKAFGTFKKGDFIPSNIVAGSGFAAAIASGQVAQVPVYAPGYVQVDIAGYTDGNLEFKPTSFVYADRADSPAWPRNQLPFSVSMLPDGTVAIGTDGVPVVAVDPRAGRWSLPGAVMTNDPQDIAALVASGVYAGVKNVDSSGEYVDVTDGWNENLKATFSPMRVSNPEDRDSYWMDDAAVEQKRKDAGTKAREKADPRAYDGLDNSMKDFENFAARLGIKMSKTIYSSPDPNGKRTVQRGGLMFVGSGSGVMPTDGGGGRSTDIRDNRRIGPLPPPIGPASSVSVTGVPRIAPPQVPSPRTASLPSQRDTSWEPPKVTTPKPAPKPKPKEKKSPRAAGGYGRERL